MNDRNDSARAIRNVMHTVAFGSTDDIDAAFDGLTAMELDELHRIGNELAGYANLRIYNASRTEPFEVKARTQLYTAAEVDAMRCDSCRANGLRCLVGLLPSEHTARWNPMTARWEENDSRTAPSEPFTGDLPMTGNPYPLT